MVNGLNEKNRLGAVYVMMAKSGSGYYIKVGTTKEGIKKRMAKLQTGCPFKMRPYMRLEAPANVILKIEKNIHRALKKQQTNGEWFRWNNTTSTELWFQMCLVSQENKYPLFHFKEEFRDIDPDYGGELLNAAYLINVNYSAKYKRLRGIYLIDAIFKRIANEAQEPAINST